MKQEGYLDAQGQPILKQPVDPVKLARKISIIALVVLIVIFIIVFLYKKSKNDKCTSIENLFAEAAFKIAEDEEKLPKMNGDKVVVSASEIKQSGKLNRDDITLKEELCKGTVTITKVKGKYIKVTDLTNCNYCTTDERYKEYGEWTDEEPQDGDYVDVKTTFNYYTFADYYTEYSDWLEESEVEKTKDKKLDIYLPKDEDYLPEVPSPSKLITIEQDRKNTYSYRDKQWLFYKYPNNNYSEYSNEPVPGYAYKDEYSRISSEPSDWSPNYPDEKDYRVIDEADGYRWYKEVDGKKVYWKSGKYYPESPGKGYKQDTSKVVPVYSYTDDLYRYYNGIERDYGGFDSEPSENYPYRDDDTMEYTTWSAYEDESSLDNSNRSYREERINVNSRYRIKYRITSVLHLNHYMQRKDFEKETGKTLEEMSKASNVILKTKYQYRYRKVK